MHRKRCPTLGCLLATLLGAIGLLCWAYTVPVSASTTRHVLLEFGGGLEAPENVFVNQSSGNLFISDVGANIVRVLAAKGEVPAGGLSKELTGEETPPSGSFLFGGEPAGVTVDESEGLSAGDIYVTDTKHNVVDKFEVTAPKESKRAFRYICEFTGYGSGCNAKPIEVEETKRFVEPVGVAVDSHGNVYISDYGHKVIDEFSASGVAIQQISGNTEMEVGHPDGLAFDPQDDLYVQQYEGKILKLTANLLGELEKEETPSVLDELPSYAVAVNQTSGNVLVDHGSSLSEYSAKGIFLGEFAAGNISESRGVAVKNSSDQVYVSDKGGRKIIVFGPALKIPTVITGEVSNVQPSSATLEGTVNPEGEAATYYFEYGTSEAYGSKTAEEPAGSGGSPKAVSIPVSGLSLHTTYHYRLVASNTNGISRGRDTTFTTTSPPTIIEQTTLNVSFGSATLKALINPQDQPTKYYFEYGTTTSYGVIPPGAEGNLSASEANQTVTVALSSLQAATLYHFRVLAANRFGTTVASDYQFTTPQSSSVFALPDNRVYELVSPAQKDNGRGGVWPLGSIAKSQEFGLPLQSSPDGSIITYSGDDFYQSHLGSVNQYLSNRGSEHWTTLNLTPGVPPSSENSYEREQANNEYTGFDPELLDSVLADRSALFKGAPIGYANLYLHSGEGFQPLITIKPPNRTLNTFGYAVLLGGVQRVEPHLLFAGGNAGTEGVLPFSHLLLAVNDALTSNAKDGGELKNNLYEWVEGDLRLVNILPDGKADPGASFGITYNDNYNVTLPNLSHVISADGSRIFWTDENEGRENLYVRENGKQTTQIDAAVGGGGRFQTASTDGLRVFFTKTGHLYEYRATDGTVVDLFPRGGVEGLLGTSEDASYVYFVSTSVLKGAVGAVAGQPNLYLTQGGSVRFIATLSPRDNVQREEPENLRIGLHMGDWYRTFAGRTAMVSPSGRYVAFMSERSLTGYDNILAGRNRGEGEANAYEVFIYDASSGMLACASCRADGTQPTSSTRLPAPVNGLYQQRYLDDNGRLFFNTTDSVVPGAANGVMNLYEWESGHVFLISPGTGGAEAVFADASASGDDIFFTTKQQLVPADEDQIVDLYDARVGGRAEESPPLGCSGEACGNPPLVPPSFGAPASSVFSGSGNLTSPVSKKSPHRRKSGKRHRHRARHKHTTKTRKRSTKRGGA